MRYDSEHKARTRRSILAEAATAIRLEGAERIAVAGIMSRLGLTHGGFYAHFESKDELVAQAISHMFDQTLELFSTRVAGLAPAAAVTTYIHMYLSRSHRDTRGEGCALAALASELPHLPAAAQAQFSAGVERLCGNFAGLLEKLGVGDAEAQAYSALAEMAGALMISRAIADPQRSDQVLRTSRSMIKTRFKLEENP